MIDTHLIERYQITTLPPFAEPRDAVEVNICAAFSRGTGVSPVGLDDDIFELGGDSLTAEGIATDLSDVLGRHFPVSLFVNFGTPRMICAWAAGARKAPASAALTHADVAALNATMDGLSAGPIHRRLLATGLETTPQAPRMFWWFNNPRAEIPSLAQELGQGFSVVGMSSGGSIAKGIPLARHREYAEAVAETYVRELLARFPGISFRLGGNCFGGRIADLVSQKLVAAGQQVEALCTLEYAHTDLYAFAGRLLMMFGRQSESRFYAPIRWGEPGWDSPFRLPPRSAWVEGAHGQFFRPEYVGGLARQIRTFLVGETFVE